MPIFGDNLDEVMSRIFMLVPIIVIIEPLPLGNITSSNQKDPALAVHIVPHAFTVLLLFTIPA